MRSPDPHSTRGDRVRRSSRLLALVSLALAGLAQGVPQGVPQATAQEPPQPNVLIVVSDDQRDGTKQMEKTRSWLGRKGVHYENAFATTPLCCPARASILTGRYAHNHGVNTNDGTQLDALDHQTTLQYYLQQAGYETALFGKFLNRWPLEEPPPYFNQFVTSTNYDYVDGQWNLNGEIRSIERYNTSYVASLAEDFLTVSEAQDEKPWFMYLAPIAPHSPYTPHPKYAGVRPTRWNGTPATREKAVGDKPPFFRAQPKEAFGRSLRRRQFRTIESLDDLMGRIHKRLQGTGEASNTLVFFLSDNGYMWGEHGLFAKRRPYTQSVKVPMFMSWPGHAPEGEVDDSLVANIDIAPTVVEAAGLTLSPLLPMDGRSLLQNVDRDRILLEYNGADKVPPWASLRTRAYQFTEYYDDDTLLPIWREYYDLIFDPYELDSRLGEIVPGETPTWAAALSEQLAADRRCEGATCP